MCTGNVNLFFQLDVCIVCVLVMMLLGLTCTGNCHTCTYNGHTLWTFLKSGCLHLLNKFVLQPLKLMPSNHLRILSCFNETTFEKEENPAIMSLYSHQRMCCLGFTHCIRMCMCLRLYYYSTFVNVLCTNGQVVELYSNHVMSSIQGVCVCVCVFVFCDSTASTTTLSCLLVWCVNGVLLLPMYAPLSASCLCLGTSCGGGDTYHPPPPAVHGKSTGHSHPGW